MFGIALISLPLWPIFYARGRYFKAVGLAVLWSPDITGELCNLPLSGSWVIAKLGQVVVFLFLPIAVPNTASFPQKTNLESHIVLGWPSEKMKRN